MDPFTGLHDSGFHELFVEGAHFREQPLAGHLAPLRGFVRFDDDHDSHRSLLFEPEGSVPPAVLVLATNEGGGGSTSRRIIFFGVLRPRPVGPMNLD